MSEQLCRWGILSTAGIARKNWAAIRNAGNGQVVAVASRNADKSQQFIDECQLDTPFAQTPEALGSYDALLSRDDIDAVYIPLPTGLRKEWVIKAAEAGKHVMCEKPCAVHAQDLQEMVDACARNNVQFMDGIMYMHSQRMPLLRQTLDDGKSVGSIKRIATQFSFCAPPDFLEGNIRLHSDLEPAGCLGDLGWYTIRMILFVMNYAMPTRVSARMLSSLGRQDSPDRVPTEFSAEMLFENGVSATFYNSFLTEHQQWVNVSGNKGHLVVSDFVLPYCGNELSYTVSNPSFEVNGCNFTMERHDQQFSVSEYANNHAHAQETYLFRNFSELALSGKVDTFWPDVALKTQKVLDACLLSAREEREVVLG